MKIPFKSLKIGAQRFSVELAAAVVRYEARILGDSDMIQNRIRVVDGCHPLQVAETLVHEICHAVLSDAGYQQDPELEAAILRVSPRIAALIADNPKQMHALIDLFQNEA